MTLGQNDFVQCCCSDIKILYGDMNFIVFTSSGSLDTIGPCSYYLARRDTTFDSIEAKKFTVHSKHSIPNREHELGFKHVLWIA